MKKWAVIIVLALGQFVMTLDATVMNVSLSTVKEDLDTTIAMLQTAITPYTLVMAAPMLVYFAFTRNLPHASRNETRAGRARYFTVTIVIHMPSGATSLVAGGA